MPVTPYFRGSLDTLCKGLPTPDLLLSLIFLSKVSEEMFYLQGSQMLQVLENTLRKHLPETLKVRVECFHSN